MNKIPFKKLVIQDKSRAIELLDTGYIGLGNVVYEFEKKLADYVGAEEVVAFDSCTSALFISLLWEQSQGRIRYADVSIPSMTVPLVACAIREAGLNFYFNDATDWVGSTYQILGTNVFDSAHELRRNQWANQKHKDTDKLCFSFYPTKTIGSADGGAVATNDKEFAKWARMLITYGRNQQKQYGNSWDYDVEMFGYKRHWTNLQAAVALEQLQRLDQTNEARRAIAATYDAAFGFFTNDSDYLYRINVENRDDFVEKMGKRGIECGVHFKPLHLMNPFSGIRVENQHKIEKAYKTTVSLPFYDTMTISEVHQVIRATKESA